jgi:hypothetical protein
MENLLIISVKSIFFKELYFLQSKRKRQQNQDTKSSKKYKEFKF